MVRRCVVVALALLGAIASPGAAHADEFSFHALLATQLAATDATFADGPGVDASLSYQIRPGLLMSYDARRHSHELIIETGIDGTNFQREGVTLGFRGALRSVFALTPRTEADTGATVAGGRVNALTTTAPANMGTPGILPQNQAEYLSADASQSVSYLLTPRMTIRQSGQVRYLQTTGGTFETRGYEIGGAFSGDRAFKVTAIGLEARASWQRLGTDEAMPGTFEFRKQVDLRAVVRVRRDFSARWSGAVEGGALTLIPLQNSEQRITEPLGSLELAYFPVWGSATFQLRHAVGPNLFLAQNEISDSVVVNTMLPLSFAFLGSTRQRPKLTLLTSVGGAYTRLLSTLDGSSLGKYKIFYADAALAYLPRPNFAYSLRGQFVSQSRTTETADPMLAALGFTRYTVMIVFSGRWPERLAVEMPLRNRVRVREITPVGDENTTGVGGEQ